MIMIKTGHYTNQDLNKLLEGFLELREFYLKSCSRDCKKCTRKVSCADINRATAYLLERISRTQLAITNSNPNNLT